MNSSENYGSETSFGGGISPSTVLPSAIDPSDCGCKGAKAPAAAASGPSLVYALGHLGFDFGSEARYDSFNQEARNELEAAHHNVNNPHQLIQLLEKKGNEAHVANVIWTLSVEATVVYAIQPSGAFATVGYAKLLEYFKQRVANGVERVSIPGYTSSNAKIRLLNGQQVPVIFPESRGMFCWSTPALVDAIVGAAPTGKKETDEHKRTADGVQDFLERVYYEIRNLGTTSQERAINHAATDAFQAGEVFRDAVKDGLKLANIEVEKSPLCRPGSDCWDVKLTFFNPGNTTVARRVYRYTVDVSDVFPVTVGKVRNWAIN